MGCDIHLFLEIESVVRPGEFDSLYDGGIFLPRQYELFAALAGVRGDAKTLFPPRGIPSGLDWYGFEQCYRRVVEPTDVPGYRRERAVFPYEVRPEAILPLTISPRWGLSGLGYVIDEALEVPSWLTLAEIRQALRYAEMEESGLPTEYRFIFQMMESAEALFGRSTRMVFWFDSV